MEKNLSYPPAQLPLWELAVVFQNIICLCFIISCQYQILHSCYWEFLPFPSWVQSWELQSTLVLTDMYLGLQIWVRSLSIFLCKKGLWTPWQGLLSPHYVYKADKICQFWYRFLSERVMKWKAAWCKPDCTTPGSKLEGFCAGGHLHFWNQD